MIARAALVAVLVGVVAYLMVSGLFGEEDMPGFGRRGISCILFVEFSIAAIDSVPMAESSETALVEAVKVIDHPPNVDVSWPLSDSWSRLPARCGK